MRAYIHPDTRGRHIGMAWGGLFILIRAFGDASAMIFSEHRPTLFIYYNGLTNGDVIAGVFYGDENNDQAACGCSHDPGGVV